MEKVKFKLGKNQDTINKEQLEERIRQRKNKKNRTIDDVFDYLDDINEKLNEILKRH